jgi:glycosyltransferase involved in cell wall biosynthesis
LTEIRPRVVFVLPTLLAGGAERVLITLMNGLDKSRFDCHFIVLDDTGPLRNWIAADIPFHSLGKTKIRHALPTLVKKLNFLRPDVVVSTMAAMNFTVLLAKSFLKKQPRFIVREAVIPSSIINAQAFPGVLKSAYKHLYPKADLVISPAQCIIDEFQKTLGMDIKNHALLYNPVDTARLQSEWSIGAEVTEERKNTVHFIASGRLHKQKGFDRLIELLPRLGHTNWTLKILGTGAEQESLQKLIDDNNLSGRVKLTGLLKEPWQEYGEADVFLLPSRWEGLPNVVLESLAMGTPVIAMKEAGGIDEIAKLAGGAVKTVSTMEDFLEEMKKIKPNPSTTYRASLLPDEFHLGTVIRTFSNLLTGSGSASSP